MNFFLNYKRDYDNSQNYKNLLGKTYFQKNKTIYEIKLDNLFYTKLKEFYNYFNHESTPKTFTEKIYSKYKMENIKIITEQDLKLAIPDIYEKHRKEIISQRNEGIVNHIVFRILNELSFEVPVKKEIKNNLITKNRPIDWSLFYKVLEEFSIKNEIIKSDLDENLKDFSILLENKDLDYEYYQSLYKKTKRNIFYSTMRDLFYSTRETNSNVLE
jgi:hypothetical protein